MREPFHQKRSLTIAAALLCTCAMPALAQQETPVDLSTIYVESIQTPADMAFPVTSSTIPAGTVERTGINTTRDLSRALPNVTGFDGGGNRMTTFTVRGWREIGYQSTPGVVPSLSYYIDDVPSMTTLARATELSNVDSITILKGPQNTSYGHALPAGTIDIRTKEPTDETTGYIGADVGNYSARGIKAGISTPLGNGFYLGFDGVIQDRDGFYDNVANGGSYGDKRAVSGKVRLTYRPSDRTQIDLFVQHEKFKDQTDPFIPLAQLRTDPYTVNYDDPGEEKIEQDMIALRARHAFEAFDMLSVTSYRHSKWTFTNDGDGWASPYDPSNPYSRIIGYTDEDVRSVTQEFRLTSNKAGPLQWSAGAFAGQTKEHITPGYFTYDGTPTLTNARTTARDFAAYGELKYAIAPTVEIAGGLRYQMSKRQATNDLAAPMINSGQDTWHELMPSLSATWTPSDDLAMFAKYTRGFRPGGFNAHKHVTDPADYKFESETSDNYEIGFQASPADGLTLGGSVYYTRASNYQVLNQISPSVFAVNNAQKVNTYGAELQAGYQMNSAFRLFGAIGTTKAEYDRFTNSYGSYNGNDVPMIPRYTFNYGVEYTDPSGVFAAVQGRLTGKYQLNDANTLSQGAVHVVDAQIGYRADGYEIILYGKNIFDKKYVANMYDFSSSASSAMGSLGDPATFGVSVKYTF